MPRGSMLRRAVVIGLFVLLCLGPAGSASAGVNVWTSAGPEGGRIVALAVDPAAPATLYAAGEGGGVFKSADGGASWRAINAGLTNANVRALAVDPAAPATLYAGMWGGGVFKSTDGGLSWHAANAGLATLDVWSLAIDPEGSLAEIHEDNNLAYAFMAGGSFPPDGGAPPPATASVVRVPIVLR